MPTHVTGTREEWLQARLDLLAAEKALTRQSDQLARLRQASAVGAGGQRSTGSIPNTATSRWRIFSKAAPSF